MKTLLTGGLGAILAVLVSSVGVAQTAPDPEAILQSWLRSPHAQSDSVAFRRWDGDAEIPASCAVCHSTTGYVAYLGQERPSASVIDHAVPTGTTVECAACHDPAAGTLSDILFPSGAVINYATSSVVCAVCHQGRASSDTVNAALGNMPDDQASDQIGFINIHYAAAAATQAGSTARGGYQYVGQSYAGPYAHVEGQNTCVSCHGAHDTKVELETCTACHQGAADLRAIRTTQTDFLGTGDTSEGISSVINTMHAELGAALVQYSAELGGGLVGYSGAAFPYFFNDLNANGLVDVDEANYGNRYQGWTPRLLRAAYNYQFVKKDRGAFAHNPHYVIQLMIDSLNDIASVTSVEPPAYTRP